jgi:hypothetical protein
MANIFGDSLNAAQGILSQNPNPNNSAAGSLNPNIGRDVFLEVERMRRISEMQQYPTPTDMLVQRFRYCNAKMNNAPLPFEFLKAVRPKDDSAGAVDGMIIMVIKDGKPLVLRDDTALFPSDTLIAQLRML